MEGRAEFETIYLYLKIFFTEEDSRRRHEDFLKMVRTIRERTAVLAQVK